MSGSLKMNKLLKVVLLLVVTQLSGCLWQTINSDEIELAQWYCSDKGGVSEINEYSLGRTTFSCKEAFSDSYFRSVLLPKYRQYLKENKQ